MFHRLVWTVETFLTLGEARSALVDSTSSMTETSASHGLSGERGDGGSAAVDEPTDGVGERPGVARVVGVTDVVTTERAGEPGEEAGGGGC